MQNGWTIEGEYAKNKSVGTHTSTNWVNEV